MNETNWTNPSSVIIDECLQSTKEQVTLWTTTGWNSSNVDWRTVTTTNSAVTQKQSPTFSFNMYNNGFFGETKVCNLFDIISESDAWEHVDKKTWRRTKIIWYDGCKKIADAACVVIKETPVFVSHPMEWNLQQHIRWMRMWFKGDKERDNWVFIEWEANKLNAKDWTVSGDYKSAMAFKRAYCKWLLRLVGLIWVYSAVEADVFNESKENVWYYSKR